MYQRSVITTRVQPGPGFQFFGKHTSLSVVVWPIVDEGGALIHRRSRVVIEDGVPLRLEPANSVDVPTVDVGAWMRPNGDLAPGWSYRVVVTVTGPGRAPVLWSHVIAPGPDAHTLVLDPSSSGQLSASAVVVSPSAVDPVTGGAVMSGGGGVAGGITGSTTFNEAAAAA